MKKLNRGSSIVGFLDQKLNFNILDNIDFSQKEVIFVVGTNGKTTITNALYALYKSQNKKVLSNLEGANLVSGINNSIIMNLDGKSLNFDILLLEVDEKNVEPISKKIKPNHIILTNFFRDQLDRYFEINLILEDIFKVVNSTLATIYINSQDPLINNFIRDMNIDVKKFALNKTDQEDSENIKEIKYCSKCRKKLKYNYFHYSHIGDFYCESCDFKAQADNTFTFSNNSLILDENPQVKLDLASNTPLYLVINYCAILNFGLFNNLVNHTSLKSLEEFTMPKGRNNYLIINNNKIYLTLAKNVVGMEQTINYLLNNYKNINLLIAFNDNYADSKDVSWIWDVDFEKLFPILDSLTIIGLRSYDLELRFLYAGYKKINIYDTIPQGIDHIIKQENAVIISNYTPLKTINNYIKTLQKK